MTYKYFKPREIPNLKPELVERLDVARYLAGIPFVINSGFRTTAQNKRAEGVPNSSHLKGMAVDLRCRTSDARYKIVQALMTAGFTRLGIGETFIHVDIDKTKVQDVIWTY